MLRLIAVACFATAAFLPTAEASTLNDMPNQQAKLSFCAGVATYAAMDANLKGNNKGYQDWNTITAVLVVKARQVHPGFEVEGENENQDLEQLRKQCADLAKPTAK